MCSFLLTTIQNFDLNYVNYYLKFRGPDYTNVYKKDFNEKIFTFIHNLLNITGDIVYQPYFGTNQIENDIVCIYNGEIYNYKDFGDYKTDGCCIIDVYKKYGNDFIKQFDGEFAIVLVDFSKQIIIMSTDIFSTKPIWYAIENHNFAVASYRSALDRLNFTNPRKIPANRTVILNFNYDNISETEIYKFDLNQHKSSYDDCMNAFDQAILKRARNMKYPIFVCLSSGYDSGAICAGLLKHNIPFSTYTIAADENLSVLNKRIQKNNTTHEFINLTKSQFSEQSQYIKSNAEEFLYKKYADNSGNANKNFTKMTDDQAASGVSYIFKIAKSKNQRIYLSGQGADEIYSDYGFKGNKYIDHSGFGGLYPNNLSDIFPKSSEETPGNESKWYSFYEGTQKSYMAKEEHISGLHGIEGRYPFIDKQLVQEFLWLKPELKNLKYKSIIDEYLKRNNYPYDEGKKIGFNAAKNLL
jgi:asparagine synthetase B (glutamine-hydrolysing)